MDIYARIKEIMQDKKETTTKEIIERLGGDPNSRSNQMFIAECLRDLGFNRVYTWRNGGSVRIWIVDEYLGTAAREMVMIDGKINDELGSEIAKEKTRKMKERKIELKKLRLKTLKDFSDRMSAIDAKLDDIIQRLDGQSLQTLITK